MLAASSAVTTNTEALKQLSAGADSVVYCGSYLMIGYGFTNAYIHEKASILISYVNDNHSHSFCKGFVLILL